MKDDLSEIIEYSFEKKTVLLYSILGIFLLVFALYGGYSILTVKASITLKLMWSVLCVGFGMLACLLIHRSLMMKVEFGDDYISSDAIRGHFVIDKEDIVDIIVLKQPLFIGNIKKYKYEKGFDFEKYSGISYILFAKSEILPDNILTLLNIAGDDYIIVEYRKEMDEYIDSLYDFISSKTK